jgi:hypothetical protein
VKNIFKKCEKNPIKLHPGKMWASWQWKTNKNNYFQFFQFEIYRHSNNLKSGIRFPKRYDH